MLGSLALPALFYLFVSDENGVYVSSKAEFRHTHTHTMTHD